MFGRPFLPRLLQLRIVFASERMSFHEEDSQKEGYAAAWNHEVVDVSYAMSYKLSDQKAFMKGSELLLTISEEGC